MASFPRDPPWNVLFSVAYLLTFDFTGSASRCDSPSEVWPRRAPVFRLVFISTVSLRHNVTIVTGSVNVVRWSRSPFSCHVARAGVQVGVAVVAGLRA